MKTIKRIFNLIKNISKLGMLKEDWMAFYIKKGLKVGDNCRIYSMNFGTEPYLIEIGNHVTIANNVFFITHDGAVWVFREEEPEIEVVSPIKIFNNVFIGYGTVILPGTTIEDNVVVGAHSVVKGTLESGFVYAGAPIRKIKKISDYRETISTMVENTKSLGAESKRKFYEEKFNILNK